MLKEIGTSPHFSHKGQHVKTEKKETYSYILREFPTAWNRNCSVNMKQTDLLIGKCISPTVFTQLAE